MNKNVLFITTWGIGNIIQLTPTIKLVSDAGYKIDLYSNPVFHDQYDLLENWICINKIYLYPKSKPNFSSYDYLIYHHPSRREKFSDFKKWRFSNIIIENSSYDPFWMNEVKANVELAEKLLNKKIIDNEIPKCHIEYEEFPLNKKKVNIVLAPTTHPNYQLWRPKYWIFWNEFIRFMTEEYPNWQFWIVGSPNDSNIPIPVNSKNIENLIGKIGIKKVAGLIKFSNLVICNETGIGWIADALDTPCLTLWTCTNMRKNWPRSNKRKVVFKQMCNYQPCHTRTTIPGLFCPDIKRGKVHSCGYSFSINDINNLVKNYI